MSAYTIFDVSNSFHPHVNPISLLWRQLLPIWLKNVYITSPSMVLFEQLFVTDILQWVISHMLCFLTQPRQKLTKVIKFFLGSCL